MSDNNKVYRPKVLVIGPSRTGTKGGMATVIDEIDTDEKLREEYDIDIYESHTEGSMVKRLIYCGGQYLRFRLARKGYDIYHIHAASRGSTFRKGLYVNTIKKWGKKSIFHIHGSDYMDFYNGLDEKKKGKVRKILKTSDMVIALSEGWKKQFDEAFGITNCCVLENGINTHKFEGAITASAVHQKEFLALGRVGKRKGSYDLVDAMVKVVGKIPDAKLYLAGDGEVEEIRKKIVQRKLEDSIIVAGWIDGHQKLEYLNKVSTMILPSYNEGLPMAILEAMACGKAIISTRVGAIPEVVDESNGILLEAGDVEGIAEAMIRCASDVDMLDKMQQANIDKIMNSYSTDIMHEKMSDYYSQLLKK